MLTSRPSCQKYDFLSYSKLAEIQAFLLTEQQQCFQALLDEGKVVAKVDSKLWLMTLTSQLQSFSFPKGVQTTLEDLPFDSHKHFSDKTEKSLLSLKDSRATLQSLGIYTLTPTHRQQRSSF